MDWHSRFLQQAAWTADLRSYLFERTGLSRAQRVLEVGCGTGAVLSGLITPAVVHGLDLDPTRLVEARSHAPAAALVCGDALALPYASGTFDITFCHFLLLWVHDPRQSLVEMKRVTRPSGAVLALAEPDYDSRLDKPDTLIPLGRWQTESLRRQGADPGLGRRLADLFRQAELPIIETGTLWDNPGSRTGRRVSGPVFRTGWDNPVFRTGWDNPVFRTGRRVIAPGSRSDVSGKISAERQVLSSAAERELEWEVLESDLAGWVPAEQLQRMKLVDEQAWKKGERILQVPVVYAWGSA